MQKWLISAVVMTMALAAAGQTVTMTDTAVDTLLCRGYFPQLDRDGKRLLVSNTEGHELRLVDLTAGTSTVVSDETGCGFDARFAPDGTICYVTMQQDPHRLVWRTLRQYDPTTRQRRTLLEPQHGALLPAGTTSGLAYVGEGQSWTTRPVGPYAYTRGATLFVVRDGKTRALHPVDGTVGYLWASVSPNGDKVLFNAAARGTFVTDLDGRILAQLDYLLMPVWWNNDYVVGMNSGHNVQRVTGTRLMVNKADGTFSQALTDEGIRAVQPMVAAGRLAYTTMDGTVHIAQIDINE